MASRKEEKEKKNVKEKAKKVKSEKKQKRIKKKQEEIEVLELEESSAKTSKKNKKSKKKKLNFANGPVEFVFNFISLVVVICVGLYYGGRSFYYYSLQNKAAKESAQTLNGLVLVNNKLVNDVKDVGLHKDEKGFFFKGNVTTNYVWFANRMFRVMRINNDNTVKVVTDDLVSSFMWGDEIGYDKSNVRLWLNPDSEVEASGIYYKTIPAPDRFVTYTTYTIDKFHDTKVEYGDVELKDKVATVTLGDYINAGGKNSYLNNGKLYFIVGYNTDDSNLYIEEDGSIAECSNLDGYGIRGVITFNKNLPISQGTGTKDDPYVIDQGDDKNYVDSYVKLGDDIWKVYNDENDKLKMYLNDYIKVDGNEIYRIFSSSSSKFYFFDEGSLGSYLYNDYYNSLSYKNVLVENTYPYGMMSAETGYWFPYVYLDSYTAYIATLNLFDYVSNNNLNDFFRGNTKDELSTTQYSVLGNGALDEAPITDQKHIVPVVSISSKSIKSGSGRIDNPYVVG